MMIVIANPIYDIIFKALLEDPQIARGLLSIFIGLKIIKVRVFPQEHTRKDEDTGDLLGMRMDFCALVETRRQGTFQVIIELQKIKLGTNPLRFRQYLASRYMATEQVQSGGIFTEESLPVIPVYLLGYGLDHRLPMATRVVRQYRDAVTGEAVSGAPKNPFIEQLTHDALFIQIPKIEGPKGMEDTELERILSIFDQGLRVEGDEHRLEFDEKIVNNDPLLKKILARLNRLQEDAEMEKLMRLEDLFLAEQKQAADEVRLELQKERELHKQERRKRKEADRMREQADLKREEEQRKREEAEAEVARLRKLLEERE